MVRTCVKIVGNPSTYVVVFRPAVALKLNKKILNKYSYGTVCYTPKSTQFHAKLLESWCLVVVVVVVVSQHAGRRPARRPQSQGHDPRPKETPPEHKTRSHGLNNEAPLSTAIMQGKGGLWVCLANPTQSSALIPPISTTRLRSRFALLRPSWSS